METTSDEQQLMPQASLGAGDFKPSKLGLGCWPISGVGAGAKSQPSQWGPQSPHDSRAVLEVALRRGITHFDTSDSFAQGGSESQLGHFLQQDYHRREGVFVATKGHAPEPTGDAIEVCMRASMKRLEVDAIDLYYVPWPFPRDDMKPMFRRLDALRSEGLVHAVGVSNFTPEQIEQVQDTCRIDVCQMPYSLIWRQSEEKLLPFCRQHEIDVVTCASLGQGVLADSFPHEQPVFDHHDIRPTAVPFERDVWGDVVHAVQRMKQVAYDARRPLVHVALRWLLNQEGVSSILAGARNAIQVNELAGAMVGDIDDAVFDELTSISEELAAKMPKVANMFRYYP
jgi:myo-inositol catabolism protein IolS